VFVFEEEEVFGGEGGDGLVGSSEFDGGVEDDELGGEVEGFDGSVSGGLGMKGCGCEEYDPED
jgi:hypothetical protein